MKDGKTHWGWAVAGLLALGLSGIFGWRYYIRRKWRTVKLVKSDWPGHAHTFQTPWGVVTFDQTEGDGVIRESIRKGHHYEMGQRTQPNGTFEVYFVHPEPGDPIILEVFTFNHDLRAVFYNATKAPAK